MNTIMKISFLVASASAFLPGMDGAGGPDLKALEKMIPKEILEAPVCEPKKCEDGKVPVQKFDADANVVMHYGCDISKMLDDVGLNQLNLYSMGMLNIPKLQTCCARAAACYATCGMPMQTCFSRYEQCAEKVGKTDANMVFPVVKLISGFLKDMPGKMDKDQSFVEARCQNYEMLQNKHCDCVDESEKRDVIEKGITALYEKAGQKKELEGDNYEKKMGPIRERWLDSNNEAELFSALFTKFEKRLIKKQKRPPIKIGDIPGIAMLAKHPYVKMGTQAMGIDLKELGIDVDDEADEAADEAEEEEVEDAEL